MSYMSRSCCNLANCGSDVVFAHMTGDVFSSFRCGSILDMTYYIRLLPNIFLVDEGSVKLLDWDDDSYIGTQVSH